MGPRPGALGGGPPNPSGRALLGDPNLHVVFAVTLMAMLGVASVTPAFPSIAAALNIAPRSVGLLVSAFTVPGVVLTPFLGVLADRFGRKPVLVPSLVLFGLAGSACGLARSFELLVALRLLQGVGAAALGAINVTLIGDLYAGRSRTEAMGYNSAVLSVGTAVYPAIGGALATIGWHWPFFLPILAVPVALIVLFVLRSPVPVPTGDLSSYLRGAARVVARWDVLVMLAAGLVTFVLLYGAYLTYLPFVLVRSFGATPLGIGGVFASASVATAVTSFALGRLTALVQERRLVLIGFTLYAAVLGTLPHAPSVWVQLLLVTGFGAANGIVIPSILSIIAGAAPEQSRAVLMSVNGMLLRLGQTLGPLLAGTAYAVWRLEAPFWISAGVAAGMLLPLWSVARHGPGRRA
jgi:ACDE family multidrug resistance protein